jgi:kinesin family protein 18/19
LQQAQSPSQASVLTTPPDLYESHPPPVRVRPPSAWESARLPEPFIDTGLRADGALSAPPRAVSLCSNLREIVKVVDDRIILFDPDEKDRAKAFLERGFIPPGTKRYKDKRFMFDRVLDREASQTDVYESTAKPLLDGLLDGYNATVFAYGVRDLLVFARHSRSRSYNRRRDAARPTL